MNRQIEIRDFSCNRGDLTIRGKAYYSQAIFQEKRELPPAILCHGFKANYSFMEKYARAFALFGYRAFAFDFCGGCTEGMSDGNNDQMSVMSEVTDLETVIDYVRGLPEVNCEELVLMGNSQGGLVAALAAAKHADEVKNLILFYPALCIPDHARSGQMAEACFDPKNIPDTFLSGTMKMGRCYAEDAMKIDPYREMKGFHGNCLIVHGRKDPVVSMPYIQKAYELYRKPLPDISKKTVLHIIEGAGHGFAGRDAEEAIRSIADFIGVECDAEHIRNAVCDNKKEAIQRNQRIGV